MPIIPPLVRDYGRHLKSLCRQQRFTVQQEGVLYHCPLTLRKRHNLALQQINKQVLHWREIALPNILHVGVTTLCNLRCPGCPTGTKALGRKGEHLDMEVYRRTVNELRSTLMFMLFWDWGEPFMHPDLAEMVSYAKQSGIKTVISTSGTIRNSQEEIDRLVEAGPDVVIVCIDGATQETYSTYRVGGKLNEALDTLRRLADAKKRLKTDYPVIEFRSLATKYTEDQMPQLLAMAEDVGADNFSVKTLRPYDYRGRDIDNELVPITSGLARYAYENDGQRDSANRVEAYSGKLTCGKPLYAPTLNSDGNIAFCSYAKDADEKFGDVSESSFRKIWQSRSSAEKRIAFLENDGTNACQTCYFRTENKPTVIHTVQLQPFPSDLSLLHPKSKEEFLSSIQQHAA
jgi:radical SAM protein with 4Fe4S-binding SPASM domain